jgi:hypothetical protein
MVEENHSLSQEGLPSSIHTVHPSSGWSPKTNQTVEIGKPFLAKGDRLPHVHVRLPSSLALFAHALQASIDLWYL